MLEQRERLIVKLALLAGMRPGEILALTWERLHGHCAEIRQRLYRGKVDVPKTTNSVRKVALSEGLLAEIESLEGSLNRHQSQSLGFRIREFEDTGHQRQLLAEKDWTEAGGSGVGLGHFSGDEADPFIADE